MGYLLLSSFKPLPWCVSIDFLFLHTLMDLVGASDIFSFLQGPLLSAKLEFLETSAAFSPSLERNVLGQEECPNVLESILA